LQAIIVRPEEQRDRATIARVVEAAFGRTDEARLVEALRAGGHAVSQLTLVAEQDGTVVGHVMQSYVTLDGDEDRRVLALGPLAVVPARQRDGIGGALMREAIRLADERGEALIVLLGTRRTTRASGSRARGHWALSRRRPPSTTPRSW